jgi:acyl-coenzyme A synthetase/AMP-(fatty) acid ligase
VNLIEAFLAQAAERADAPAIIAPNGRTVSFGELAKSSAARAHAYECSGIAADDVVLVGRGVSIELYETLLAIFRLGAVAMFPEPAAGLKGLKLAVEAVKPKAMAVGRLGRWIRRVTPELWKLKLLAEPNGSEPERNIVAPIPGTAPALITFTSGSTGRPKGIVRSVDFLMLQHRLLEELRQTKPSDVDLISLPVFILSNLAAGAARLNGAKLRKQMEAHGVNRIVAPPAVVARIVEDTEPMEQLSAIFTGGGPVFPNLLKAAQRAAPNAAIHAVYGSTEAEPIAHLELKDIAAADWEAMANGAGLLAGRPISEIEVDIRDHEVFVAGEHVNQGYLDPEDDKSTKSRRDGKLWHRTGDAARVDEQGRLWLLGRREAASGALFPFAVETAALSWPGVKQAALLAEGDRARLALSGEGLEREVLQARAAKLGKIEVIVLKDVPMDKRHNSKADYAKLQQVLGPA